MMKLYQQLEFSDSGLRKTLALLQQVVIGGELDEAINNASDKLRAGFNK